MTAKTSGDRWLAQALNAYGVTHVFMVPTVAVPALAAMDQIGIEGITAHSEKAAAYMADGYARIRRGPGICLAQAIGSSNLAAGLRDAAMAGSPVIALTGGPHPRTRYRNLYQEVEDFVMFGPVTKANMRCEDVRSLPHILSQAVRAAVAGSPGPTHIELAGLAGNVLSQELDAPPPRPGNFPGVPLVRSVAHPDDIRRCRELLEQASRPIVVAGGGVRWSGAQEELVEFARRYGIPIATSFSAKGVIDERDPLSVGVVGASSRPSANRALMASDLVFFVGSQTGSQVTDNWRMPADGVTVVHLDIDAIELGRNFETHVALCGDAQATLQAFIEADAAAPPTDRDHWLEQVQRWAAEWRAESDAIGKPGHTTTSPQQLCQALSQALPDDAVVVVDTGHAGIWAAEYLDIRPSQQFLRAAGSLGWAFPAALGAAFAAPTRPIYCFTGDGGLYYHVSELETAVRHQLNVIVVVNDNASLGQDLVIFRSAWNGSLTPVADRMWRFGTVDFAEVAQALGATGIRVNDPTGLDAAFQQAQNITGPVVVDVRTDPERIPNPPYGGVDFYSN